MTEAWAEPSRFGIRARLLTLLLPGILGLLVLDSWNDYRALRDLVQDSYDRVMLDSAQTLRSSLSPGPDGRFELNAIASQAQALFNAGSAEGKHLHVGLTPFVAGTLGQQRSLLGEGDLPAPPAAADRGTDPVWYDSDYRGRPVRIVALRSRVVDGQGQAFELLVQAAEGTEVRDRAEAASFRQELIRDARMVLVMVLLVALGVTWSLQPLERLRRSVLRRKGELPAPLDRGGVPHEVAPLVDALNLHVAGHRDLLEQQAQFLADASHQLRTPLAIMLTQAGVALREKDDSQLRDTLRAIVTQVSRSRRLCEQLLSLAHASDGSPPADAAGVSDLNAIAREVVLQYLSLAHEKDQDLGWIDAREGLPAAEGPAVPVRASAAELHEVLSNLVHNAIVHTPVGGRITVQVGVDAGHARAEVRDDGPGIPAARRAAVFERFRQAGSASGQPSRGAGLGLSIARAYARRNGGDVSLDDAPTPPSSGLRATLTLPLAG
jgi:two-component system sensor histidine kinase TctE